MDRSQGRRDESLAQSGGVCPSCGGSGVLRTDAAGYRTCLECVGQGALPRFETSGFAPAVAVRAAGQRRLRGFRGDLSAWSSGG
jgi:DnaJ-class molecular chaperone